MVHRIKHFLAYGNIMKKRFAVTLIGIFVLLLFKFTKLYTLFSLLFAFKDFNPANALPSGPASRMTEYLPEFLSNTLSVGAGSLILTCVLTFLFLFCLLRFHDKRTKYFLIALIAVPFFIPAVSYMRAVMLLMQPIFKSALLDPPIAWAVYLFFDTFRYIWIPVLIGILFCRYRYDYSVKSIWSFVISLAFFKLAFLFFVNTDQFVLMYSFNTHFTMDSLDAYLYGRSPAGANPGDMALYYWLYLGLQALAFICGISGLLISMKRRPPAVPGMVKTKPYAGFWHVPLYCVLAFTPVLVTGKIIWDGLISGNVRLVPFTDPVIIGSVANSLSAGLCIGILCGVTTIVLAYPLLYRQKGYALLLIAMAALPDSLIGEYITNRIFHFDGTIIPLVLEYGVSIGAVFLLYFIVTADGDRDTAPELRSYFKKAVYPAGLLAAFFFAQAYGSFLTQMYAMDPPALFTAGAMSRGMRFGNDVSAYILNGYDALASVIPAVTNVIVIITGGILSERVSPNRIRLSENTIKDEA